MKLKIALAFLLVATALLGAIVEYGDGVTQKFNPNGTSAGFNFGSHSSDPSALENGDAWVNSATNLAKIRLNGATEAVATQEWISDNIVYAVPDAVAGDAFDDRPAIQTALDAVEAAGGGVVRLGPGAYRIHVIYDNTVTFDGGKIKLDGHYGLEIPDKVTLEGAGREVTALVGYLTTDNSDTGAIIAPKGWRSAAVAYACGAPVLRNLSVYAADTNATETGICVAVVHSSGFRVDNVRIGPAYYHGIDHDYAKGTVIDNCVFRGPYAYSQSGSHIQWDAGDMGAGSTHLSKSAAPNANMVIEDTIFEQRPNTDTSPRDLDLAHGECEVRGLTFRRCTFYGRNSSTDTSIVDIDTLSVAGIYNDISFEDSTFYVYADAGNNADDNAIRMALVATTGEVLRGRIHRCTFNGTPNVFNYIGSGSANTVTTGPWAAFKGWQITDNTYNLDQSGISGGTKCAILAYGLQEATIRGNKVWLTGNEGGATTVWPYYLNNTSGAIYDNVRNQLGTVTSQIAFVHDCAGAETAVQAGTIPYFRAAFFGNSSYGNASSGHFFLRGANGIDGGSNYDYKFWGNAFSGTGSGYDLTYQYFGTYANAAHSGGQVLGVATTVDFTNMVANAEDTKTVTVTGARASHTATVDLGWSGSFTAGIVVAQAWVSSADTVSIRLRNTSAGDIDPALIGVRVTVRQF